MYVLEYRNVRLVDIDRILGIGSDTVRLGIHFCSLISLVIDVFSFHVYPCRLHYAYLGCHMHIGH